MVYKLWVFPELSIVWIFKPYRWVKSFNTILYTKHKYRYSWLDLSACIMLHNIFMIILSHYRVMQLDDWSKISFVCLSTIIKPTESKISLFWNKFFLLLEIAFIFTRGFVLSFAGITSRIHHLFLLSAYAVSQKEAVKKIVILSWVSWIIRQMDVLSLT